MIFRREAFDEEVYCVEGWDTMTKEVPLTEIFYGE